MKRGKQKTERKIWQALALSQIFMFILSSIAFSFILGGMVIFSSSSVNAASSPLTPTGCCLQANDGSFCQNMDQSDAANCKSGLLATDCSTVSNCQTGCCYDASQGSCSFNSPKDKCLSSGGNWTNNPSCNIPECTLGCCILADQASITTPRQCSILANQFNFQRDFQPLDSDGTCNSKINLFKLGACTSPSSDFSGLNDCVFTTKQNCNSGNFYEGYLCTANSLKTNCLPAKNTTCVSGKDQIYYLDSCGNTANIYDSTKFSDQSYWEKIISPSNSCSPTSADCGNCDYMSGSRCYAYRQGQDTKPTIGNNVCRDLNCQNGKKHGESWCLSDYSNIDTPAVAPVGSRWFKAECFEGDISIQPCADFNNEICVEQDTGLNASFTEAQCKVNQWRDCLAANNLNSSNAIIDECSKYDECTMFLDIPGNDAYSKLPGFDISIPQDQQGAAGKVGKGSNAISVWCVPKYTPGMVFWQTQSSILGNTKATTSTTSSSTLANLGSSTNAGTSNGGSLQETQSLCKLGSFTCVSHKEKKNPNNPSAKWEDKENPECNYYAEGQEARNAVPLTLEAFNERCRSLGPCGTYVNIEGNLGRNIFGNSIKATKINAKGKQSILDSSVYTLDTSGLSGKPGIIKAGSLLSLTAAVIGVLTGRVITGNGIAMTMAPGSSAVGSGGAGSTAGSSFSLSAVGSTLMYAAAAAYAGYEVGKLIGKWRKMTPGQTTSLSYSLAVLSGGMVLATSSSIVGTAATATTAGTGLLGMLGPWAAIAGLCWPCIVVVIVAAVLTYMFTGEDNEYYILSYSCEPWKPPLNGDCSLCNNDIRACSEYRCKSLGSNCQYYNSNGEPGWCAAFDDSWSAKITPWQQALTPGNKYTDVTNSGFKIEGNFTEEIQAWVPLQFGIETDKPAQCKIDNKHTKTFDEMSTSFMVDSSTCLTGTCSANQGTFHKIVLSPFLGNNSAFSTLGFVEGDNEYYIRCQNYAGLYNSAEFAVKIKVGPGQDLTPPIITSLDPITDSYLSLGSNSTGVIVYVNEPADCKYSQGVDNRYEDMTQNLTCLNDPNSVILGNWPCFTFLNNLTTGINKFYFQCQDQPNLDPRISSTRNINRNSKDYTLNVCSTGLNITALSPRNTIISGQAPVSVNVTAETSGCINNGDAVCSYRFAGGSDIAFFKTGSKIHTQVFSNLNAGQNNITITCQDIAGNIATDNLSFDVFIDNQAPIVTRNYINNQKITIITNEVSTCRYVTNSSVGCFFNFYGDNSTSMDDNGLFHYISYNSNADYFIKCSDNYNNINLGCAIITRTY